MRVRDRENFRLVRNYTADEQCEDETVVGLVGVSGSSLKYDMQSEFWSRENEGESFRSAFRARYAGGGVTGPEDMLLVGECKGSWSLSSLLKRPLEGT